MNYQFRPLAAWPTTPTKNRRRAPFGVSFNKTLADLGRELTHLHATHIVIQARVREDDIRLDGMLRAGAKVMGSGIILSFESKVGPLSYPCDTYLEWEGNLRAISLALTALRAVDRYGVTARAEQYKGWQALPPPTADKRAVALSVIAKLSGWSMPDVLVDPEGAYRVACARTHPDRGGNAEDFKAVQEAKSAL